MLRVELNVRDGDGQAIVVLRGELDGASTPTVAAHLRAAVAACGPSIILDLAGLDYVGYGGLGVLLRARRSAQENGGDLALAAPQQQVRRVLAATGLTDVFAIYPSTELAATAGRRRPHPPPAAVAQPRRGRVSPILASPRDVSCSRRQPPGGPLRCGTQSSRRRERRACRWRRATGGAPSA